MSARDRQATVVAIGGRAVLIEGRPGLGKSSLALALIDRGAVLVGDDSVRVEAIAGRLLVRPHPATRGLLEVRELGLVSFSVCEEAAAALVVRLVPDAPRFAEGAQSCEVEGIALPMVVLRPDSPVLAIKTELALKLYGLSPG